METLVLKPRRVRVSADAARVGGVQGSVLLAHRTSGRRNCEVLSICRLSDDRGGHPRWRRGHQRSWLDSLELKQEHLKELSLRRCEVANHLGDDCENFTLGAW